MRMILSLRFIFVLVLSLLLFNPSKAMDVVTLDLRDQGITDVGQIFVAEGITDLILSSNQISDLSGLKLPGSLKKLFLGRNNISNIDNLQLPEGLETLSLGANQISSISNANLPSSLKQLFLTNNQFNSFNQLDNLPNSIVELDLDDNQITGGTFDAPSNLIKLNLSGNPVGKLENLVINAANLRTLFLFRAGIVDISDIGNFQVPNSEFALFLGGNDITDLSPLVNAVDLAGFSFGADSLTSLAGITLPANLTFLDIGGQFTSLDGLVYNDKLEVLSANANLTSVSADQIPVTLRKLNLAANNLTDLSNLNLNNGLESIDISLNSISDSSKLPRLPKSIRRVDFSDLGLTSLEGYVFPKNTRIIGLDDNGLSSIPRTIIPRGSRLRRLYAPFNPIASDRESKRRLRKQVKRRARSNSRVIFNQPVSNDLSGEFNF